MSLTLANRVHNAVAAVCPIEGVSIGVRDVKSTWTFHPTPGATKDEKVLAQQAIEAFELVVEDLAPDV